MQGWSVYQKRHEEVINTIRVQMQGWSVYQKRHEEVINTIRVQMQISEAMDACVRQTSMQFASRKACGQLDIPQIAVGLLNGIFKSDFLYEKPYMQWKKRQANVLEEVLISANHLLTDKQVIETLLAKINNSEEGATREDIEKLLKYKFRRLASTEKPNGEIQGPSGGVMTECGSDSPSERILAAEDLDCCMCLR